VTAQPPGAQSCYILLQAKQVCSTYQCLMLPAPNRESLRQQFDGLLQVIHNVTGASYARVDPPTPNPDSIMVQFIDPSSGSPITVGADAHSDRTFFVSFAVGMGYAADDPQHQRAVRLALEGRFDEATRLLESPPTGGDAPAIAAAEIVGLESRVVSLEERMSGKSLKFEI